MTHWLGYYDTIQPKIFHCPYQSYSWPEGRLFPKGQNVSNSVGWVCPQLEAQVSLYDSSGM